MTRATFERPDLAERVTERPATPLRALGRVDPAGYRVLRDHADAADGVDGAGGSDGTAAQVLELMRAASDLRADSDDLARRAHGWAQRYHVDPARANLIRALGLPADARVLEVAAGCGAVTRYLGETCAVVDALEPVPARAAAAAARTADLPGVEIVVGELADVPDEPVYDVVVAIDVLEHAGRGSRAPDPYRAFLAEVARRLAPGGSLVVATANPLGVKYLAGAPAEHTGRVFDSIESYPQGTPARGLDRQALESLVRGAGLHPAVLGAFPDHCVTRAVLGDLPAGAESLWYRIPRFPSPDLRGARPRLADERAVWEALVRAGLAREFSNSFLVLAGKDRPSPLWPDGRYATFYSGGRRPELTAETVVEGKDGEVVFRRRPLLQGDARSGTVELLPSTLPFRPGVDLPRVVAQVGIAGAGPYLDRWLGLLDAALAAGDGTAFDVVPHNLVLDDDGVLHPIDRELRVPGVGREQIIRRGIFLLAKDVTATSPPQRWAPCTTIGDVMAALGALVGLPADGSWLEPHVQEESELQMQIRMRKNPALSDAEWLATIARGIRSTLVKPLVDLPIGERLPARAARLDQQSRTLRAELAARTAELTTRTAEVAAARAESARAVARADEARAALARMRAARPAARARRVAGRLLPRGTRRRRAAERLLGLSTRARRAAPGTADRPAP